MLFRANISWAFLHTTEADVRSERERWQGHTWIHPTQPEQSTITFCVENH